MVVVWPSGAVRPAVRALCFMGQGKSTLTRVFLVCLKAHENEPGTFSLLQGPQMRALGFMGAAYSLGSFFGFLMTKSSS